MFCRSRMFVLGAAIAVAAILPTTATARPAPSHPGAVKHDRATKHRHSAKSVPVVRKVAPHRVAIGGTLDLRGRNFVPGRHRDSVVFRRPGGRYIFVKARLASTRHVWVTVPKKLIHHLSRRDGRPVPTRFRVNVVGRRFGARFTKRLRSPVIVPPKPVAQPATCQSSGAGLPQTGDADRDGLPNALEVSVRIDPCATDTDGDGMSDFWEYKAALDYNSVALPYPGHRPYPNALDPTDAVVDHDGDGLFAGEEYAAWAKWGDRQIDEPLFLSDGTQSSRGRVTTAGTDPWSYLDINDDGILTDDERDSDLGDPTGRHGDGLGNWDERRGRMTPMWWSIAHDEEKPYGLSRYAATDWLAADTDGDGVLDGADDVDHDGYPNQFEMSRKVYWNQPFNPCLPDPDHPPVRTCSIVHPGEPRPAWPPFDRSLDQDWSRPLLMSDVFGP